MIDLTKNSMIKARLSRNHKYDGKFFVGAKTMKIYCLPSCKARLSLIENMVFFQSQDEAIAAGYRGCKRCNSAKYPKNSPLWFEKVSNHIKTHINQKLNEDTLVKIARVDITTIRRHFKLHLGLSPMMYHRKLRLEYAKQMIEFGTDQQTVSKEIGFKSLNGFREAFLREYGINPGNFKNERR